MKTKEIKIKTPYGDKNWSFVKRCFDSHNDLLEACKAVIDSTYWDKDDENYFLTCDFNDVREQVQQAINLAEKGE